MSIDQLGADLNTACMYLGNITQAPPVDTAHPPFYILPNMPITNAPAGSTALADELYFQIDAPLPFKGSLASVASANSAASVVANGGVLKDNNGDNTFTIECQTQIYRDMVNQNQTLIFKDNFDSGTITSITPVGVSQVQVVIGANAASAVTGLGSTGLPLKTAHLSNAEVVIALTGQVIRYRVQYLQLDPTPGSSGIPCLVRDQGTFVGGVFTPGPAQQVITENIQDFKAYLSVNAGQGWAGYGHDQDKNYSDMGNGWGGIMAELTTQLKTEVTNGFTAITGNPNWFRFIPTVVRVDVTTQTATQRTEFATKAGTAANRLLTQSLIFMPRHSGLPMD